MKTAPSPRLVCRVLRHSASPHSRHVANCSDCQRYFASAQALESALRHDARQLPSGADAGLEQRILYAVQRAQTQRAPAATRRNSWGLGYAASALAAVALIAVVWQRQPTPEAAPGVALTRDDAAALVDSMQSLSDRVADTVIPSAGALVADNPLQQEMSSIYSDARSALGFLALNFLPSPGQEATATPRSG